MGDKTPLHTPLHTPERVPLDTGHQSGGEWNQTHGNTPNRQPDFNRGVVPQHPGTRQR